MQRIVLGLQPQNCDNYPASAAGGESDSLRASGRLSFLYTTFCFIRAFWCLNNVGKIKVKGSRLVGPPIFLLLAAGRSRIKSQRILDLCAKVKTKIHGKLNDEKATFGLSVGNFY